MYVYWRCLLSKRWQDKELTKPFLKTLSSKIDPQSSVGTTQPKFANKVSQPNQWTKEQWHGVKCTTQRVYINAKIMLSTADQRNIRGKRETCASSNVHMARCERRRYTRTGHWEIWMAERWSQNITCTYDNPGYSQTCISSAVCARGTHLVVHLDVVAGVTICFARCSVFVMVEFAATQMLCDVSLWLSVEQWKSKSFQIDITAYIRV